VVFHLTNALWAGIGMFPWLAIAASALFFPPDWPRRILAKLELARPQKPTREWKVPPPLRRKLILGALTIYAAIQIVLPLRFLLWRGGIEWTWAEHRFSWRMFLWTYGSTANFYVNDPNTGESAPVDLSIFLTARQAPQMGYLPDLPLQFAHYLAAIAPKAGPKPIQVRARIYVSINGRKPTLYIDPIVDLAAEPRTLGRPKWLLRNDESLPPKDQRYHADLF
jgi:hypothetical protein